MPDSSNKGRCRSCGFLAKQSSKPLPGSPNKPYFPISPKERETGIELHDIRDYLLGDVPTVLACYKEVEPLDEEVRATDNDVMAVADKDRHCPEWYRYFPGRSPEQHLQFSSKGLGSADGGAGTSSRRPPFPNLTTNQIRRDRINRAIQSGGRPDPEDLAKEAAEEKEYQRRVAEAFRKKELELHGWDAYPLPHEDVSLITGRPRNVLVAQVPLPDKPTVTQAKNESEMANGVRSPTMVNFSTKAARWRDALYVVLVAYWDWVLLLFIAGLFIAFGGIAMSDKSYTLAEIFYFIGVGLVVARVIYAHSAHTLRKEVTVIASLIGLAAFIALVGWTEWKRHHEPPWPTKELAKEIVKEMPLVTPAQGFLQWEKVVFVEGHSDFAVHEKFGANVWSKNPGPTPVYNADGYEEIIEAGVVDPNIVVKQQAQDFRIKVKDESGLEQFVGQKFEESLKAKRQDYLAGRRRGEPELGVGHGVWGTVYTHTLSKADVDAILKGTLRLYFLSWFAWADQAGKQHEVYDCRWLQSLPEAPFRAKDPIWHSCQTGSH